MNIPVMHYPEISEVKKKIEKRPSIQTTYPDFYRTDEAFVLQIDAMNHGLPSTFLIGSSQAILKKSYRLIQGEYKAYIILCRNQKEIKLMLKQPLVNPCLIIMLKDLYHSQIDQLSMWEMSCSNLLVIHATASTEWLSQSFLSRTIQQYLPLLELS